MNPKNRTALVTGGAQRLGRAFTLALAEGGADVIVHYRRSAREAEECAGMARARGVRAAVVQADLSDPEAAANLMERAATALAAPNILVNSAAIFEPGTIETTSPANWESHLAVNLRAPFLLTQSFARLLGERPGTVVNVADWRAACPGREHLAYTVSKSALLTLTEIGARTLAPRIRVNALALGAVLPPPERDTRYLERVIRNVPSGRAPRLEEVTEAMLFLVRNESVTGEILFVDGGAHLMHG